MAFETEFGNYSHVTDVLSDALGPAIVESVVVTPLVYTETAPSGTNVKLFRKDGSLSAQDVAESASHTYASGDEFTQSEVTATLAKSVAFMKITIEAERFAPGAVAQAVRAAGNALARRLDDKILALFDGFSSQITATSTLTVDDLLDAVYTVHAANAGAGRQLNAVLDHKGLSEIRKEVNSSQAAIYSQPQRSDLLAGPFASGAGYAGTLPGCDIYSTSGLPTDSGDDVALVFNPDIAIAGMIDAAPIVWESKETAGGMYTEFSAALFNTFVEWYDEGGCGLKSDT